MVEKRLGRQTPSRSFVLPYELTDGARAVEIYNSTGFKAQEWQELFLYDILAFNEEGLWVHTSFGFSLPRRNGKNKVITIREMYGLIELGEQITLTRGGNRGSVKPELLLDRDLFYVVKLREENLIELEVI